MKASDLRVGSILNVSLKSGQGRTLESAIRIHDLVNIYENSGSFNYEPIPLTEEWLLKFGFTNDYESMFRKCFVLTTQEMAFVYNLSKQEKELSTFEIKGLNINLERVNHVHQLQNLYFALTGEELTIGE